MIDYKLYRNLNSSYLLAFTSKKRGRFVGYWTFLPIYVMLILSGFSISPKISPFQINDEKRGTFFHSD